MEVIPAINCHRGDFECVSEKVRKAESFFAGLPAGALAKEGWVHVDIADGLLTFNKSWDDPDAWRTLKTKLNLEVHLMVEDPEDACKEWLRIGAKRIIFHLMVVKDDGIVERILDRCKDYGAEAMLAIMPEEPLEEARQYFGKLSQFQIFAQAHLGPPGQKFLPAILPKIRALKSELPGATIEVDGGINLETARMVKDAGGDIVIAGSYTFNSPDPKKAYESLKKL